MNNEVIKLTEEIGKCYVEISKQTAKIKVLETKVWKAKSTKAPTRKRK